jgi:ATP-dependent Lon protease
MQLSDYAEFPTVLPIATIDDTFFYPFMISSIFLSDISDIKAATMAIESGSLLFLATTKAGHEGKRSHEDIYDIGVVGNIMRKVEMPDGKIKILFQGMAKAKLLEKAGDDPLMGVIDIIKDPEEFNRKNVDALLRILRDKIKELSKISNDIPIDLVKTVEENDEPNRIADLVSSMLHLTKEKAYELFIERDIEERLIGIINVIDVQIESINLQREISNRVHNKIEKSNKEYFLKEQLKEIQKELGVEAQKEEEIARYRSKLEKLKPNITEEAYKEIKKQLDRFARMHPDSADSIVLQNYLEWVFDIPFDKFSKKNLDVKKVAKELDKDHYSLEKPKERIVEFFSVKELLEIRGKKDKDSKGVILCFFGPPGVGKTSLANSIAKALDRPLVRIALGGLEDVNELRGHRRTYVGAMPGRIVQGLIEAKSMDPVVVLDEIDKVGRSHNGDPTAALLEILDPEQNTHFRDYYLNFHIDLSKAIFIATANVLGAIPAPLRDRMEIIDINSYTPDEKYEIARRYLIPQELKKHGLRKDEVTITKKALRKLIDEYTREAGVRELRRKIASLMRKAAREILENPSLTNIKITAKKLPKYAGKRVFEFFAIEEKPQVGIVNGLAWTSVGGDVLTVEAIKIKAQGPMKLTGSLGDVMKESAKIANSVVEALIDSKKLEVVEEDDEGEKKKNLPIYKRYTLHLHVPEGATPKDGPSAGITMATAIASLYSQKKVDNKLAMTGELTLTGRVLPIGGLKEKLIAAYKTGIKRALIPKKNYQRDLEDIPKDVLKNVEIIPVERIEEVLEYALIKEEQKDEDQREI